MTVRIPRGAVDPRLPRLTWPGRKSGELCVEPAPQVVRQRWGEGEAQGRLVLGDNLAHLAAVEAGSVRLAYLDPPFFSGTSYAYRTRVGEVPYELPAFEDGWKGDLGAYLAFLEDRLRLVARALTPDGSLYVHLDAHASHYVKVLLDEILGAERFTRQIVWRIGWVSGFKTQANNWVRNHDVLLYYARPGAPFHRRLLPHPEGYKRRGGKEGAGRPLEDVWTDLPSIQIVSYSGEKTGWATQKNEALLKRIVDASSDPGDLVLDAFGGAGSTAVAAAALGRRFTCIDASPLAVHLARRRLVDAGVPFTVEGDAWPAPRPLTARVEWTLAGVVARVLDAPEAAGPEGTGGLERLDAWWVHEDGVLAPALWHVHRKAAKRPGPVPVESEPLMVRAGTPLVVEAADLAGGLHRADVVVPDRRGHG